MIKASGMSPRKQEDVATSVRHAFLNVAPSPALVAARVFALALALSAAVSNGVRAQKKGEVWQRAPAKTINVTKTSPAAAASSSKTITVSTQPGAAVWVDEVRRGVADAGGKLQLKVSPGRHVLRVRAAGFQERVLTILPTKRGAVEVRLTPTKDQAELLFQQAEDAREHGGGDEGRKRAVELYRQALRLRPRFPAAHVGLARVLLAMEDNDSALEQIAAARRDRPAYPEASAVEGRIMRALADQNAAVASYRRAIREGQGFQPEAYTGMGIVLEEKGDYEGAVAAFRKAISQLSDSEPALYQLTGAAYEKLERWKDAVSAYEKYLELSPEGAQASAIRSIIDQLRQQAAEQQTPPQ
ncbi:MAG: tetratricopeptide repeat protein [Acidobacteria bacterium]|nr:tetratricopeptide repeat protein [Acidobacteriota bacterium]